ncbi:hypothetical protein IID24_03180 [Patescibacteria group bacterium]|nr:hypothetical protein [Patescibacteria group bacterium]
MKIKVINRGSAETYGVPLLSEDYVLISISCPGDKANVFTKPPCKGVLFLQFDDIDAPAHILKDLKCTLFCEDDAKKILDFYQKYKDLVGHLIVHCDAGISRSPAVAAALDKIETGWDQDWFKKYLPNRRVYSLILTEYYYKRDKQ